MGSSNGLKSSHAIEKPSFIQFATVFFSCCCYRICFLLWRALTIASPWQWNLEFSVSVFVMNRRKPAFRASKWIVNMFAFGLVWYGLLWFGWVDSTRFWTFDIELISINCIQAILPFRHFNAYPQARINNQNRLNLELLCHNATKSHFINQPFIFLANVHVFGTHSFSIDHGYRSARKRYTLKCRIRHFNAFNDKNANHIFVFVSNFFYVIAHVNSDWLFICMYDKAHYKSNYSVYLSLSIILLRMN